MKERAFVAFVCVLIAYAAALLGLIWVYVWQDAFQIAPTRCSVSVAVQVTPDDPYYEVSGQLVQQVLDRLNATNTRYRFTIAADDDDPDIIVIWGSSHPLCQRMPWGVEIGIPEGTSQQMQAALRGHLLDCLINAMEVDVE